MQRQIHPLANPTSITPGWSRRGFMQSLGAGAAMLLLGPWARAAEGNPGVKPNVILINVDDLGWADVGCYGSTYYETPHIDRLAAQGMKFTDAYAACAVCSPSRAAILTGRYPARIGITDWIRAAYQGGVVPPDKKHRQNYESDPKQPLQTPPNPLWMDLDEVTIAEALGGIGYKTCHIGKWHLGPEAWYPDKQGFDENHGGCDFGEPPSFFDPYHRPANPNWKEPALQGIPNLPARKEGEYLTDREADEAVTFIRANKDRPFFINLCHYAVHMPIQAKPDLVEKYKAKPNESLQTKPVYAAMVHSVDDSTGQILKALDDLDLASRTIVIFTSDNGGLRGPTHNAPLRAGKGSPYEGGIRVPLIVRWPGRVKPGSTSATPVTGVDIFPTLCATAGASLPADRTIDGQNLLPLLEQTGQLSRDAIFWHFPHYRSKQSPYSAARQGSHKLIKYYNHDGPKMELFDLAADMGEATDLAAQQPAKVQALDALLTTWLKETGAKMPRPNPDYQPPSKAPAK